MENVFRLLNIFIFLLLNVIQTRTNTMSIFETSSCNFAVIALFLDCSYEYINFFLLQIQSVMSVLINLMYFQPLSKGKLVSFFFILRINRSIDICSFSRTFSFCSHHSLFIPFRVLIFVNPVRLSCSC